MANIGYRTFNGTTDRLSVTLGNIASANSVPETWIWAGRLLSTAADAEIVASATFTPLDFFLIAVPPKYGFYDDNGAATAADGPTASTTVDVIVVARRATSTALRWSIATHNGTSWSAFTHTNSGTTFVNHAYAGSGVLDVAGTSAPINARFALLARCSASLSDAAVDALVTAGTSSLDTWKALANLTNLWKFQPTVTDLQGTSAQSSITGTTTTATAFPIDEGTTAVTGTAAVTQDNQTSTASGAFGSVTGTATPTQADQTSAATGVVRVTGTAAVTQDDQTSTATGSLVSYELTDDFSTGTTVGTPPWTAYERIGDLVNSEVNGVLRRNVRVSGGSLLIDSKFETVTIGDSETAPQSVSYTSGQVGQVTAPFLYGDVQVRAKLPGGTGLWPCIWMLGFEWQPSQPTTANIPGHNWPNDGWWEIDIAEFMSNHRTLVNNALHFITANRGGSGEKSLPFDATTRFMVYRLVWAPTSLTWMVDAEDGVGWRTTLTITGVAGTDIPNTAGWLIIHTAIGGIGGGTPNSATFPQTFEIDYARVLKTVDTVEPITTAYVAATQNDQTSTASGTATPPGASGSAAVTQDAQTSAAVGSSVTGSAAITQADQTSTASGTANPPGASGSAAVTQDDETSTAAGVHGVAGAATATQDDQPPSAAGSSVVGASAVTQDSQTATASGAHGVTGTAVDTQDDQTSTASGTANPSGVAGSVAVTQDDQASAAAGSSVVGTLATTQDDQTAAASGSHSSTTVAGTAAVTQDAQTSSAAGWSVVTGSAAVQQAPQIGFALGVTTALVFLGAVVSMIHSRWTITSSVAPRENP